MPHPAYIALVAHDHDEALAFYVGKLGFALVGLTDAPRPHPTHKVSNRTAIRCHTRLRDALVSVGLSQH